MVDLVQAWAQVALVVQAYQEGGLDMGGGGLAYFAGGALAWTPVGGAGGQGSSENLKTNLYWKKLKIQKQITALDNLDRLVLRLFTNLGEDYFTNLLVIATQWEEIISHISCEKKGHLVVQSK